MSVRATEISELQETGGKLTDAGTPDEKKTSDHAGLCRESYDVPELTKKLSEFATGNVVCFNITKGLRKEV